jgi:hypothetical protein
LLSAVVALLAGQYFEGLARAQALLALVGTPLLAVALGMRSLVNERGRLRAAALAAAGLAVVGCEVAVASALFASPAPRLLEAALWAAAALAVLVQLASARARVPTFFAVGVGTATALGLYAPAHLSPEQLATSALGTLVVALLAGGGAGFGTVVLAHRLAWRTPPAAR